MIRWLSLAGVVVVADQATKAIVDQTLAHGERINLLPVFSLVHWQNEGAAFSMLANAGGWQRWFFVALAAGMSAYIIYELKRLPANQWLLGVAFSLILGGAVGNGLDRAISGYVVDFILVHYRSWYFPAFNVADSALFLGAVCWIWLMISDLRKGSEHVGDNR
ncbi:MAG: signal peptidase II [Proteobacteria bacterium]|nr:signal peptidase II [Pseudomonadota bacterium]